MLGLVHECAYGGRQCGRGVKVVEAGAVCEGFEERSAAISRLTRAREFRWFSREAVGEAAS